MLIASKNEHRQQALKVPENSNLPLKPKKNPNFINKRILEAYWKFQPCLKHKSIDAWGLDLAVQFKQKGFFLVPNILSIQFEIEKIHNKDLVNCLGLEGFHSGTYKHFHVWQKWGSRGSFRERVRERWLRQRNRRAGLVRESGGYGEGTEGRGWLEKKRDWHW